MIYCLEAPWVAEKIKDGVKPTIKYMGSLLGIKTQYVKCRTPDSFLAAIERKPPSRAGILYISMHGRPGIIQPGSGTLNLEDVSAAMGRRYGGWKVHFGTCSTLNIPPKRMLSFMDSANICFLSGYRKQIDWIEGHAMDELSMSVSLWNPNKFEEYMRKHYSSLIEKTGFTYVLC
jgi:hypothetical protein